MQQSLSVSAQAAQLQQLQLLQQQLVQQSQLLQAQQSANKMQDEQPIIDNNLLNQIQALTNQLLSRTTDAPPSKQPEPTFNKVVSVVQCKSYVEMLRYKIYNRVHMWETLTWFTSFYFVFLRKVWNLITEKVMMKRTGKKIA